MYQAFLGHREQAGARLLASYQALQQIANHPAAFFKSQRARQEGGRPRRPARRRRGGDSEGSEGSLGGFIVSDGSEDGSFYESSEEESEEEGEWLDSDEMRSDDGGGGGRVKKAVVKGGRAAASRQTSREASREGKRAAAGLASPPPAAPKQPLSLSAAGPGPETGPETLPEVVAVEAAASEADPTAKVAQPQWYEPFRATLDPAGPAGADALAAAASGKVSLLLELVAGADALGEKVLAFSQSLHFLDVLEQILQATPRATARGPRPNKGLSGKKAGKLRDGSGGGAGGAWRAGSDYLRLDGTVAPLDRQHIVDRFNQNRSVGGRGGQDDDAGGPALLLMSTQMGLGVNLTGATRVVLLDSSWNPANDLQAVFRAWRFGQSRPVFVYRLLGAGTIEENIYARQVCGVVER